MVPHHQKTHTSEGQHEIIERVLVLFICLSIVLVLILLDCLLDDLNGTLQTVQCMPPLCSLLLTSREDLFAIAVDGVE